ncbi:MAG TPA: BrnT family toxin [Ktedonobacterales bacterium]
MGAIVEWDESKALLNERKHGVTFDGAVEVFADPLSITIPILYIPTLRIGS